MNGKKLYKSRDNRMISGVCAGIAEYFNIRHAHQQHRQPCLNRPQQNLPPPMAAAQPAQAQQHQTDQRQSPAQLSGKAHPRQALQSQSQQAERQRQRRRQSFGAFPLKKRMLIHIVYFHCLPGGLPPGRDCR